MIAASGLRGIHEWLGLIGHDGVARVVVYQNEATSVYRSRPQANAIV